MLYLEDERHTQCILRNINFYLVFDIIMTQMT